MKLFCFIWHIDITNMYRTAMVTFFKNDRYIMRSVQRQVELKPGVDYILTISPRFKVGAPVFTQRLRKTIRRINSRLRRCCVNMGAATVNRGEIVSM